MLKNNNQAVVKRLAKNNLKSNRRRSLSMVLAIMLSSFLLFSVFTVGATYLKMQRQQNIRLNGAEFDAIMYGISEESSAETALRQFSVSPAHHGQWLCPDCRSVHQQESASAYLLMPSQSPPAAAARQRAGSAACRGGHRAPVSLTDR